MKNFRFFDQLRADLRDFTPERITAELGAGALAALARDEAVPAELAARRAGSQVGALVRLWWVGDTLSDHDLALALPKTVAAGGYDIPELFEEVKNGKRAKFQIVPVESRHGVIWLASDRGSLQGARHTTDHVMGVGGATRTLASLATYQAGDSVLDLGTGCGIHAIIAAKAGAHATATDISQRALDYAQFNARLNGVTINTRIGSLFEPVAGETFSVVVSNPPFVITPSDVRDSVGTLEYRDGGAPGDTLAATVVAGLDAHVAPDGNAYMLANWEIEAGHEWNEHPQAWFAQTNADAIVIQREVIPADAYVEMWLHDGGLRAGHPDYAPAYRAWINDFAKRNVTHVGFGYVLVRASETSQPWHVFHDLRGQMPPNVHDALERMWSAKNVTPETLPALHLSANDLAEHRRYHPGETEPWLITFSSNSAFSDEMQADTALAGFLSVCDGELSAGAIMDALANLLEIAPAVLRESLTPHVIHMVQTGFLSVVDNCEPVD
ncbi:methyltransferase domain-containing protein [Arcanobacterium haemolyticum]|uniref:Methyltransferase small n=1 Tax=Arcanobacterium haemolyticum (strain ATCC 9345 / DSM 20595 / CCM 5947 / CCUG 17215 / LMG 16163 / NBRC 15585 / NCTC 8452 / 11018) TaxID=644284 RepID=D7BL57_ARCHD|nr:methyltransferase [Arcanobacterium haemolyticum]ADH93387.1 methyltransferase small [Arcanobacterium haemolyticum DSM 20595]QCX47387.1 methyltransferase domain-containing protein [Arcanobacterium haemolyticum]SPT76026.1 Ribosomal protein L11 methyltransferase [Arcanobacterium haemolyticum]SQH27703.1 Ribosomal protein L11 methyltransferase [Arcanobacterium haemolyticum]